MSNDQPQTTALDGTTAMLVAHELGRAADCRKASIGWVWPGQWTAQDWKDSARDHVKLASKLRECSK